MKRLLQILAALLVVVTTAAAQDTYFDAENGITYSKNGSNATVSSWTPVVMDGVTKGDITVLEKVTINGIEYTVTSINSNVFGQQNTGNEQLTSIHLPSTITSLPSHCFRNCINLTTINLEDLTSLTDLPMAGFCNTAITSIIIPSSVTTLGYGPFADCKDLTSVTLPNNPNITSIGNDYFKGCVSLTYVNGFEDTKITAIAGSAFENTNIESIKFPSTLTRISNNAFQNCKNLKTVNFNGAQLQNYTDRNNNTFPGIEVSAFNGCSSLENITIPYGSTTSIGTNAFANCTNLKTVSLPSSISDFTIQSKGTNKSFNSQFNGCTSLTDINIQDCSRLTYIPSSMFDGCTALESIVLPQNITEIRSRAFNNAGLQSVDFSKCWRKLNTIGDYAFNGCSSLSRSLNNEYNNVNAGSEATRFLVIPPYVSTIGLQAFYGTAIKYLGFRAIEEKYNDSYLTIGSHAFANNPNIEEVAADYEKPQSLSEYAFDNQVYNNAKLWIPYNSIEAYKNAAGWKKFNQNNIEVGIEGIGEDAEEGVYTVYNLQGVRVMQTTDASLPGLAKGIYIVNGKKVVK